MRRMNLSQATVSIIGAFAYISGSGLTISSAWLITMASLQPPVLVLQVAIVMVRFFGIARSVARYSERVVSHQAVFSQLTHIRTSLFREVSNNLSRNTQGIEKLTKKLVDDVERSQEYVLRVRLPYLMALISAAVGLLLAFWITPQLVLWILPAYFIYAVLIPAASRRWSDSYSYQVETQEDVLAHTLVRAADSLAEAEVLGYAHHSQSALTKLTVEIEKWERKVSSVNSILSFVSISIVGISIAGISLSIITADLPHVTIAMSLFAPLVFFEAFTMWFPNLFTSGKYRRALEKISLPREQILSDLRDSQLAPTTLEVRDVRAFWEVPFTQPITFRAHRGDVVVIRGYSGAGKSTFASALLGFSRYDGSITADGYELSSISGRDNFLTGTLQESHIFNTTVRENLRIAKVNATDSELLSILSLVELDQLVLDEVIGEFGRILSGGEAKRLSLARALLSEASITVLDEPLEHLDTARADRISERINAYCKNRVVIVISHTTWPGATEIVTLHRE